MVYVVEFLDLSTSDLNAYVVVLQTQVDIDFSGIIMFVEFLVNKNVDIYGGYEDLLVWCMFDEGIIWFMLFYVFISMVIVYFLLKYIKIFLLFFVVIFWCLFLEYVINCFLIYVDIFVVSDVVLVKVDFFLYYTFNVNFIGKFFAYVFGIMFFFVVVGLIEFVFMFQCVDEILDDILDVIGRFM